MAAADDRLTQRLRVSQGLAKLVGAAAAFRAAVDSVPIAARADAPVLIIGETGTGKELVARALHYLSDRAPHPFIAVNCGSLTDTLLEDELFGHERGAFTDAHHARVGLVAQAHRGTVFLDEVDSLSPRAQVALLRVVQDHAFRPVGSDAERSADVRFLAATNTPLLDLTERGGFRTDLYYRLAVFSIVLPPLRERGDDVLLLARHFLALHQPSGGGAMVLGADAEAALLRHRWPGNARELENVMTRAAHFCEGGEIGAHHLGIDGSAAPPAVAALEAIAPYRMHKARAMRTFELNYLTRLLEASGGNVSDAARSAGKERRDFGRLLKKHQLEPRAFIKRRV